MQYVYLIQPSTYRSDYFKIGGSSKVGFGRIKSYGKDTRIISIFTCDSYIELEKQIKILFNKKFTLVSGTETFQGIEVEIKREFLKIINDYETLKSLDTKPFVPIDAKPPVPIDTKPPVPIDAKPPVPIDTKPPVPIDAKPPVPIDTKPPVPIDTKPHVPIDAKPPVPIDTKPPVDTKLETRIKPKPVVSINTNLEIKQKTNNVNVKDTKTELDKNYCEYCKIQYSNKQNLIKHQNTKSCVQKRSASDIYTCVKCNKKFSSNVLLENHRCSISGEIVVELREAKRELEETITQLLRAQEEIRILRQDKFKLETRLEIYLEKTNEKYIESSNLSSDRANQYLNDTGNSTITPTPTPNAHTSIIQKLQILELNVESISKIANQYFTLEYLKEENKGVAKFTINHVIKDSTGKFKYICTDPARKIGKYKSTNNNIVTDFGMDIISNIVYDSIKIPVNRLVMDTEIHIDQESKSDVYNHQQNLNKDSSDFTKEISKHTYVKNIH
jgi:hypothetical protein